MVKQPATVLKMFLIYLKIIEKSFSVFENHFLHQIVANLVLLAF